jgi:hypothetical protein
MAKSPEPAEPASCLVRLTSVSSNTLALDLRSIALFRILLGFSLLLDIAQRAPHLNALYSDNGIFTRQMALLELGDAKGLSGFSLLFISGSFYFVACVFFLGALAALSIILGYKTRTAVWCAFFFHNSVTSRNILSTHGGDDVMKLCLFFGSFLPLDTYFAFNGARNFKDDKDRPVKTLSIATCAIVVQLLLIYAMNAHYKNHPSWHTDGTAVHYALELDMLILPLGVWMRVLPLDVTRALCISAYYLELVVPWLIFSPVWNDAFRWFAIISFW